MTMEIETRRRESADETSPIAIPPAPAAPAGWLALLGRSETGGRDEVPEVEGKIPAGLEGSLYRNGPGLFERGQLRKPHLLDGDGLVQRLSFQGGQARYRNEFVRTEKFVREAAAGTYLYSTLSMRRPGGRLRNLGGGGKPQSQAGVTVQPFAGKLYAFDEVSPAWTLDPETLATLGPEMLGDPAQSFMIKAHTKLDPVTGEWLLIGVKHGRRMKLHTIVHGRDGSLRSHRVMESPRQVYLHDFFATRNYFIFLLHPMFIALWPLLSGQASFIDSLRWRPEEGNLLILVPREGGAPRFFEAPPAYMWHALNAYEEGGEIVADFVGYDEADHFTGRDASLRRVMTGTMGLGAAPGMIRRYRLDLARGRVHEEILDRDRHEFPILDPRLALGRHDVGFFTAGGSGIFNTALKRVDFRSGQSESFEFGAGTAVGEPVFAPRPGAGPNQGWLISQCLDGATERSFFAIFDSERVAEGPEARLWLGHSLPLSFHGAWEPENPS